MSEPGFFEILNNTRAIKRLKPDPVPIGLIRKVVDAGTKARPGTKRGRSEVDRQNTQLWLDLAPGAATTLGRSCPGEEGLVLGVADNIGARTR